MKAFTSFAFTEAVQTSCFLPFFVVFIFFLVFFLPVVTFRKIFLLAAFANSVSVLRMMIKNAPANRERNY